MIQIRGVITSEYIEGICCVIFINWTLGCTISVVATLMYSEKNHKILKYSNVGSYCILLPIDCVYYRICYVYNYFSFFLLFFKKENYYFKHTSWWHKGNQVIVYKLVGLCLFI